MTNPHGIYSAWRAFPVRRIPPLEAFPVLEERDVTSQGAGKELQVHCLQKEVLLHTDQENDVMFKNIEFWMSTKVFLFCIDQRQKSIPVTANPEANGFNG
ncbi:hypothetical protein HOLleu_38897 [Holothuria leucospilota]|uniref:Uncharacterized protein n=1 Tax=Holothuria leucospilota TaxID=206669 RepID=A0A9Q0YF17_HOLLE|nr:hypothetical protein HOLleu_38897 [Holothuria leucospilota]